MIPKTCFEHSNTEKERGGDHFSEHKEITSIFTGCVGTVLDLQVTSCPSTDGVTIATESSPGYLSNTLYDAYSSLGWYSCPWVIRALQGQRIQLTLLTLQVNTYKAQIPLIASRHDTLSNPCIWYRKKSYVLCRAFCTASARQHVARGETSATRPSRRARQASLDERDRRDTQLS